MIDIEKAKELWPPTGHGRWMSEECAPGLVSIIIPAFNRAQVIGETLDSVCAQTYRPVEIVVVDDGSADRTVQRVHEWAKRFSEPDRLSVRCFSQPNRGAPSARNLGLIESSGEYIQFLDSDDWLLPEKLELQIASLNQPKPHEWAVCQAGNLRQGEMCNSWGPLPASDPQDFLEHFLSGAHWQTMCPLYRRSACRCVGPWTESQRAIEDWQYAVRSIGCLSTPVVQDVVLCHIRCDDSPDHLSSSACVSSREWGQAIISGYHSAIDSLPHGVITQPIRRAFARWMFGQARLRWEFDRATCQQMVTEALQMSPGMVEYWRIRCAAAALKLLGPGLADKTFNAFRDVKRRLVRRG